MKFTLAIVMVALVAAFATQATAGSNGPRAAEPSRRCFVVNGPGSKPTSAAWAAYDVKVLLHACYPSLRPYIQKVSFHVPPHAVSTLSVYTTLRVSGQESLAKRVCRAASRSAKSIGPLQFSVEVLSRKRSGGALASGQRVTIAGATWVDGDNQACN